MPTTYHITEPHPTTLTPTITYGRGGAGNTTRLPSSITPGATACGPASRIKLTPPPSSGRFLSGRGGAGNVHRERERAMFSFDEELKAQERLRESAAPVYHVGRGGAGNVLFEGEAGRERKGSTGSSGSDKSERDVGGVRRSVESAWGRVSRGFSHN